jgi:glutamine amidotransferase
VSAPHVAVVDYGMGNLHSVARALEAVGAQVRITPRPEDLAAADRIVLPGVGAFGEGIRALRELDLAAALSRQVIEGGKPFLGICLGMQLLARESEEMGRHGGLGWLPGTVRRLAVEDLGLKVPCVGWNEVSARDSPPPVPFEVLERHPTFYFLHSYHLVLDDDSLPVAVAEYGRPYAAAVVFRNVLASQFHPEKSQTNGLKFLEAFLRWRP